MNLQKTNELNNLLNQTSGIFHAIFGHVLSRSIFANTKKYKNYLNIGTFDYFLSGILLSDLEKNFIKEVERKKIDDILDESHLFNEEFVVNTLIEEAARLCKRKDKDIKSSLQFLFIALEDKAFSQKFIEQLDYVGTNDYSRYVIEYEVQKFHLLLILPFVKSYKSVIS